MNFINEIEDTYLIIGGAVAVISLLLLCCCCARAPKNVGNLSYSPSWLTIKLFTSPVTDYDNTVYPKTYNGKLKVLIVCTEKANLTMANGKKFFTGNHPVETMVPMLHMQAAGFDFDVATYTGNPVVFEQWAMPNKDTTMLSLYEEYKPKFNKPLKIEDIPSSYEGYAAIFIPGGHGAMIDLPESKHLGRLLRAAHARSLPTFTLCHGPGTLLSAALGAEDEPFAYDGYKIMLFPDKVDKITPALGYLPGQMPWMVGEMLGKKGVEVLNDDVTGATHSDRELITGDSPTASNAVGKLFAERLIETYVDVV